MFSIIGQHASQECLHPPQNITLITSDHWFLSAKYFQLQKTNEQLWKPMLNNPPGFPWAQARLSGSDKIVQGNNQEIPKCMSPCKEQNQPRHLCHLHRASGGGLGVMNYIADNSTGLYRLLYKISSFAVNSGSAELKLTADLQQETFQWPLLRLCRSPVTGFSRQKEVPNHLSSGGFYGGCFLKKETIPLSLLIVFKQRVDGIISKIPKFPKQVSPSAK